MPGRVEARGRLRRTAAAFGWSLLWVVAIVPAYFWVAPLHPRPSLGWFAGTLVLLAWLLRPNSRRAHRRYAGIGMRSPGAAIPWLAAAAIASVSCAAFMQLLNQTFYHGPAPAGQLPYPFAQERLGWLVQPLAVGLMSPLLEELAIRGQLQPRLARVWGNVVALVVAAAVFALLHYTPGALPTFFVVGLLFGYARWTTRSIWAPIGLHAAHNGVALLGLDPGALMRLGAPALLILTVLAAGAYVALLRTGARAERRARMARAGAAAAARAKGALTADANGVERDLGLVAGRGVRE